MSRILQQGKSSSLDTGTPLFQSPGKHRKIENQVTNLDDFENDVLRCTIYEMYDNGEYPTLKKELCFSTPKRKKGVKKPRIPVDAFMDSAIRQKIREFYVVKKECPSIRRLFKELRKDNVMNCGHDFLRKRLHKIGFKCG